MVVSRREVLATTAAAGVVTAATAAMGAPEKAAISFGNPDDPPQGQSTRQIPGASRIPVLKIRPSGTSFHRHFRRRPPMSAEYR
jgi:hypothetical protein